VEVLCTANHCGSADRGNNRSWVLRLHAVRSNVQLCCWSYRPFTHGIPSVFTRGQHTRTGQLKLMCYCTAACCSHGGEQCLMIAEVLYIGSFRRVQTGHQYRGCGALLKMVRCTVRYLDGPYIVRAIPYAGSRHSAETPSVTHLLLTEGGGCLCNKKLGRIQPSTAGDRLHEYKLTLCVRVCFSSRWRRSSCRLSSR
jgi:hypothetical protein